MEKPITLRMKEVKKEFVNTVNTSELPAFIIEYLLKDILETVSKIANQQAENEEKAYMQSICDESKVSENE